MDARLELVQGWLVKASHDLAAGHLLRQRPGEVGVHHCQQEAEKALKAFLVDHDQKVEKTHDIGLVVQRAATVEPGFDSWVDAGERLTPYARVYRYPGLYAQPDPRRSMKPSTTLRDSNDRFSRSCPQRFARLRAFDRSTRWAHL